MAKKVDKQLMDLKPSDFIATEDNPRTINKKDPEFVAFAADVKENGVQVPVAARPHPTKKGKYDLRYGERRLVAAVVGKLPMIPALVYTDLSDEEAFDLTFFENYDREDLKPLEEAKAVAVLMERKGGDIAAVAKKLKWSERAVRRRIQIRKLSPAWAKMVKEGKEYAAELTAGHLELIARLPAESQDRIRTGSGACWNRYDGILSVKDLRERIGRMTHALSSAPWAVDVCASCKKHTGAEAQILLWDEPKGNKPGARCLDPKCWLQKMGAYVKERAEQLKKEHPNLAYMTGESCGMSHKDEQQIKKKYPNLISSYGYASAKKSDKKAIPVLTVVGAGAGKLRWVKKQSYGGYSGGGGSSRPKETPAAKKAKREYERWKIVGKALSVELKKNIGASLSASELMALAATIGTDTYGGYHARAENWRDFKKVKSMGAKALWPVVREVLTCRLDVHLVQAHNLEDVMAECDGVGKLFGYNVGALYKKALAEIPEPKAKKAAKKLAKKKSGKRGMIKG